MASSRIAACLYVLSFASLVKIGMGLEPLHYDCFNIESFNSTGHYASYLKRVLHVLSDNTSLTGFATASTGNPKLGKAYGLALCRGDVSSNACKACVIQARNWTTTRCPNDKGAIVWYDNCFLKYTNTPFFGKIDNQNELVYTSSDSVSDLSYFIQKQVDLFLNITEQAYVSPKLYASGYIQLNDSKKLYGFVQCTRDLSVADCKQCIADAMNELLINCRGKEGARVIFGSCGVRYELYPFFGS